MPPDAASIARYAKQRRLQGGREGWPKADADAALKARPGRGIFIAIPKTSLNLRLRKCAVAGNLVRLSCIRETSDMGMVVPTNSKGNDHFKARQSIPNIALAVVHPGP